ncbi:hypothetical protein D9611_001719 [Ephemerocybe angulata]|uniref:Uncharacterized protein n=1 Tax=Ephemerocybe angulata TaxID=980116 RepID=A0A8H5FMQ2_9AGAR|nr:hypothetical protein D9611_001719 [Tulosesus angulatus]
MRLRSGCLISSLNYFSLERSAGGCQHLAGILRLPSDCSRSITHRRLELTNATDAVAAGSRFLQFDIEYKECAVGLGLDIPFIRLVTRGSSRSAATLRFDLSKAFIDLPNPQSYLNRTVYFPQRTSRTLTGIDVFHYRMWLAITSALRRPLSTVLGLHLWFDTDFPAPYFFRSLLRSTVRLREVVFRASDIWTHPSIHTFLDRDIAPALTKLKIPLDATAHSPKVVEALTRYLRSRLEITEVTFRVRRLPKWAPDTVTVRGV